MAVERGLRGATAASLAVHGALGLWLLTRPPTAPTPPATEDRLTEIVFIEVEPAQPPPVSEVRVHVDVEPAAATAERPSDDSPRVPDVRAPTRPRVRRVARQPDAQPSAEPPFETAGPLDGPEPTEPPERGGLAMRTFSPRGAIDGVAKAGPRGDGRDARGEAAREGRPSWMPAPSAPAVGAPGRAAEGDYLGTESRGGSFTYDKPGYKATTLSDGRVVLEDKPNVGIDHVGLGAGIGITGHFDLTDWVERLAGNDPYASEKLRYLDRTRERRAKMIKRHEGEVRRNAAFRLRGHLRQLWNDRSSSPAKRRRQLFQLWDECDVDNDGPRGRAAAFARTTIEAFIRRRLPAGSEQAFTRDELARFNRTRSSSQPFAPYEMAQ